MIPELPTDPRQALEASLTALLLGELPPEQAEFLQRIVAQDPELKKQFERLKQTIELVRDTREPSVVEPGAPKLSDERRQELLQHFKTVASQQFGGPTWRQLNWLMPIAVAACIVALLGVSLSGVFSSGPSGGRRLSFTRQLARNEPDGEQFRKRAPDDAAREKAEQRETLNPLPTGGISGPAQTTTVVLPAQSESRALRLSETDAFNQAWHVSANAAGFYKPGASTGSFGGDMGGVPWVDSKDVSANREVQQLAEQRRIPVLGNSPSAGTLFAQDSRSLPVTNGYGGGGYGGYSWLTPVPDASSEQLDKEKLFEEVVRKAGSSVTPPLASESPPPEANAAFSRRYGLMTRADDRAKNEVAAKSTTGNAGQLSLAQTDFMALADSSNAGFITTFSAVPGVLPPVSTPVLSYAEPQTAGEAGQDSSKLLEDGKELFNKGRLQEAETQLAAAAKRDPQNQAAYYYLNLAKEAELKAKLSDNNNSVKSVAVSELSGPLAANEPSSTAVPLIPEVRGKTASASTVTLPLNLEKLTRARGASVLPYYGQKPSLSSNQTDPLFAYEPHLAASRDDLIAITPPHAATNAAPEETLPAGMINFPGTDLNQVLQTYAELAGRTVLRPTNLPPATITFKPQTPRTRREAIQELDAVLALNGFAVVDVGNKFVKVVRAAQAGQTGAPFSPNAQQDAAPAKPAAPAPIAQPEVLVRENAFSTFSLNVSDVSFKLAAASLEKGQMPEAASIRSEEFINAFDYRDPEPALGVPIAFASERARYPFAQNRDLLRFSIQTAASGRQPDRPLNVVLLLDNSGSMERTDRVAIIHEALRVLATQLQAQDTLSVVTFARTARLWVDGVPGTQAGEVAEKINGLTPQGGTNLEEAMTLAYQTALRHYLANGMNRVVLLTDGAANLGDVDPDALKRKAESYRKQGIALDCFGIGWEGYNDDLLEVLARNSDGRYGFINTPEEAATEFAGQLAGALQVAASDLKVQVEFNPNRVTAFRQIGYAKHQLSKEQFRDNTVNAAQLGAAESGNALYVIDCNPGGQGVIATVRVRYRVPATSDYREQVWDVPYTGTAMPLEQSSPAMRLAASAGAFAEWLASSPYAAEVTPDTLLGYTRGVPEAYGADPRPKKLEWMIRQAKSISGK